MKVEQEILQGFRLGHLSININICIHLKLYHRSRSVHLAYQSIKTGDSTIVVAGGQENMTRSHHTAYMRACRLGHVDFRDSLLTDGLTDAFANVHMGNTAEHVAVEHKLSRELQDEFALLSQTKTKSAIDNGCFTKEIVPIADKQRVGKLLNKDEFPKPDTTLETLQKLRPAFSQVCNFFSYWFYSIHLIS